MVGGQIVVFSVVGLNLWNSPLPAHLSSVLLMVFGGPLRMLLFSQTLNGIYLLLLFYVELNYCILLADLIPFMSQHITRDSHLGLPSHLHAAILIHVVN